MFQLDHKNKTSIYEQVVDYMKKLMVTGVLKPNDRLPSVREFSKTIIVNPNTVSKAYKELERQGYVYSITGKGTFVTERKDDRNHTKLQTLLDEVYELYKEMRYLGYHQDEVIEAIKNDIYRRDSHDKNHELKTKD